MKTATETTVKFYFNTGVKYMDYPYLSNGQVVKGGLKQIPFECENVPEGARFSFASDNPNLHPEAGYIVREIKNSSLLSKYAYFTV